MSILLRIGCFMQKKFNSIESLLIVSNICYCPLCVSAPTSIKPLPGISLPAASRIYNKMVIGSDLPIDTVLSVIDALQTALLTFKILI